MSTGIGPTPRISQRPRSNGSAGSGAGTRASPARSNPSGTVAAAGTRRAVASTGTDRSLRVRSSSSVAVGSPVLAPRHSSLEATPAGESTQRLGGGASSGRHRVGGGLRGAGSVRRRAARRLPRARARSSSLGPASTGEPPHRQSSASPRRPETVGFGAAGEQLEVDDADEQRLRAALVGIGGDAPLERLDQRRTPSLCRFEPGPVGQAGTTVEELPIAASMPWVRIDPSSNVRLPDSANRPSMVADRKISVGRDCRSSSTSTSDGSGATASRAACRHRSSTLARSSQLSDIAASTRVAAHGRTLRPAGQCTPPPTSRPSPRRVGRRRTRLAVTGIASSRRAWRTIRRPSEVGWSQIRAAHTPGDAAPSAAGTCRRSHAAIKGRRAQPWPNAPSRWRRAPRPARGQCTTARSAPAASIIRTISTDDMRQC